MGEVLQLIVIKKIYILDIRMYLFNCNIIVHLHLDVTKM